jgi:hypothetical protein
MRADTVANGVEAQYPRRMDRPVQDRGMPMMSTEEKEVGNPGHRQQRRISAAALPFDQPFLNRV